MKWIFLAVLSLLTVGCAAPTVMVDVPRLEESSRLSVADLRPETEKEDKIFSYSITSEAYGTYRRGDDLVNPTPVRILQHRIYEKYSEKGDLPDVKVHHLVVYANLKSELRRGVMAGVFGGAVGAGIASSTKEYGVDGLASLTTREEFESFKEEYQRALYTEAENPEKVSVYKVFLEAELDGRRTFIKTMTRARLPGKSEGNPHVVALETAISYFLDQY